MESALNILVRHLSLPDPRKQKNEVSFRTMISTDEEPSSQRVHKLRLLFLLVKGFLQNAAVSSQLMKHDQALENANVAKFYFKLLIYNLQHQINLHVALAQRLEQEITLRGWTEDTNPYFAPDIEMPELKKFQRLASSSVIYDFGKFCREALENDPTEVGGRNENRVELSNVILWRHNTENNERYFKKELATRSRDLGVTSKLATLSLRDFNIGNVMHIKPISLTRLNEEVDFAEYFNVKLAVEVLLTYCCCLFSIATENRFICQKEFEAEQKPNEFKGTTSDSKKSLKIYKLLKNPNFVAR